MNDPILPDLPEGFYLAIDDKASHRLYEHYTGGWHHADEPCIDPRRMTWHGYTLHSIPALLSAAGEQDALWADWCDSLAEVATLELVNETMMRRAEEAEEERDEALAELAEARVVLTKLEWWHDDREHVCMSCHSLRSDGHAPDCSLAAALAKAKS